MKAGREREEDTQERRRMRAKSKFHANQNVINSWLMPKRSRQAALGPLTVAIFIMKMIRLRRQTERERESEVRTRGAKGEPNDKC